MQTTEIANRKVRFAVESALEESVDPTYDDKGFDRDGFGNFVLEGLTNEEIEEAWSCYKACGGIVRND